MAVHDPDVAAHTALALNFAFMKHLQNKGLLKGEEGADILNLAIQSVVNHPNGPAIIALLKEATGQDR